MNSRFKLRKALAEIYSSEPDWREAAKDLGLDPTRIELRGKPWTVWGTMLSTVREQGLMDRLRIFIESAEPQLVELFNEYRTEVGKQEISEGGRDRQRDAGAGNGADTTAAIVQYLGRLRSRPQPRPFGWQARLGRVPQEAETSAGTSLSSLLCAPDRDFVFLQGPSGIGKSIALEMFAREVAERWKTNGAAETSAAHPCDALKDDTGGMPVPVLVRAAEECMDRSSFLKQITEPVSDNPQCLKGHYVLLLVDRLDAFPPGRRDQFAQFLRTFAADPGPNGPRRCRVVIASRHHHASAPNVVQLERLTVPQARAWLNDARIDTKVAEKWIAFAEGDPLLFELLARNWADGRRPIDEGELRDGELWDQYLETPFPKGTSARESLEVLALTMISQQGRLLEGLAIDFLMSRAGQTPIDPPDRRSVAKATLEGWRTTGRLRLEGNVVEFQYDRLRDHLAARALLRQVESDPQRLISFLSLTCTAFWKEKLWYHEHIWFEVLWRVLRDWAGSASLLVSALAEQTDIRCDVRRAQFFLAWAAFAARIINLRSIEKSRYTFEIDLHDRAARYLFLECAREDEFPEFIAMPGNDRTEAFDISTTPITVFQFLKFVRATAGEDKWPKEADLAAQQKHPNRPIVNVTWEEADEYCAWVGRELRRKDARLPTREEWCVVAGGGTFPWGSESVCEGVDAQINWWGAGLERPAPVGTFARRCHTGGIIDFGGNIYEWSDKDYDATNKILLGAAWYTSNHYILESNRNDISALATKRRPDVGFRCVTAAG